MKTTVAIPAVTSRGVFLFTLMVFLIACAAPPPPATSSGEAATPATRTANVRAPESNLTTGCVDAYAPGVDYFPDKATVEYAGGFSVEYRDNVKIVTVTDPWQGADQSFRYLLVQCGTPVPQDAEGTVIRVPVANVIALSTTYLPHMEALGVLDTLVGIDSYLWTTNSTVRAQIEAGSIAEVGGGASINVEQVLDLEPDLVMTHGLGLPEYDAHPVLQEAGVPVVLNGDFVEQRPLGRTEWLKFVALFFNREAAAQQRFDRIAGEYNALAELAAEAGEKPTVFLSSVYDGTWWMPGGDSYTAHLLEDAGANYLWSDDGNVGSNAVDFEVVFDRAAQADFWLNPDNNNWMALADVLASDERYGDFAAVQTGGLYNNNALLGENGGNAFYEEGAANPNVVLKDLVKIFHPDLLPDHELVYYRQVE